MRPLYSPSCPVARWWLVAWVSSAGMDGTRKQRRIKRNFRPCEVCITNCRWGLNVFILWNWRAVIMHVARGQKSGASVPPTITIQLLFLHKRPSSSPPYRSIVSPIVYSLGWRAAADRPNRSRFTDDNKERTMESGSKGIEGRRRWDRSAKLKIKRFATTTVWFSSNSTACFFFLSSFLFFSLFSFPFFNRGIPCIFFCSICRPGYISTIQDPTSVSMGCYYVSRNVAK